MTQWTLGDIAECLQTSLANLKPEAIVSGISTDSRTLEPGSLFVPLVGEKFDGHDYVQQILSEGQVTGVVWARHARPEWLREQTEVEVFYVEDSLDAYQALGLYWKKKCGVRCVGVTGSVGKTTTKEFLAHFLGSNFRVHKSRANHNNDIGVPKTLLELRPEHELVIVEMGMRGRGEIARLVRAAEPDVGIITAIGTSHLELLGSREEIARAKGELVEGLSGDGQAVLPYTDDYFDLLESLAAAPVTSYAAVPSPEGVISPETILVEDAEGTEFILDGRAHRLPMPGRHHLHDFFAVLAVGQCLGVAQSDMLARLPELSNPDGRAEWISLAGAKFYLDAYNSAPESLRASLEVLQRCEGRRVAILGDMLELGQDGPKAHQDIGASLPDYGVELALCYGPLSEQMAERAKSSGVQAHWFQEKSDLTEFLSQELRQGDSVLVKASRGMALETVVHAIKERVG